MRACASVPRSDMGLSAGTGWRRTRREKNTQRLRLSQKWRRTETGGDKSIYGGVFLSGQAGNVFILDLLVIY